MMKTMIGSEFLEVKLHDRELWHKRLGYVNYKLLNQLGSKAIVKGIPMFGKQNKVICGDCKTRKPTKLPHS